MKARLVKVSCVLTLGLFFGSASHAAVFSTVEIEDVACTGTCSVEASLILEVDDVEIFDFRPTAYGRFLPYAVTLLVPDGRPVWKKAAAHRAT